MGRYCTLPPLGMDGICLRLWTNDKERASMVRLPLGTRCVGVLQGVRGHMWARTAPPPHLEWMEYVPAWGPITMGVLPSCVFPAARGALGSCRGLEGTCWCILHPRPLGIDGTCPRLRTNDKGCAPIVRLPPGTWCAGLLQRVRGHMWARTAPPSPWNGWNMSPLGDQ